MPLPKGNIVVESAGLYPSAEGWDVSLPWLVIDVDRASASIGVEFSTDGQTWTEVFSFRRRNQPDERVLGVPTPRRVRLRIEDVNRPFCVWVRERT